MSGRSLTLLPPLELCVLFARDTNLNGLEFLKQSIFLKEKRNFYIELKRYISGESIDTY